MPQLAGAEAHNLLQAQVAEGALDCYAGADFTLACSCGHVRAIAAGTCL